MPRPENLTAEGIAKAARQQRYRAKLRAFGEPEADRVDTALADILTAFIASVDEEKIESMRPVLKTLVASTLDLLVHAGYDRAACKKVLHRRLSTLSRPEIRFFMHDSRLSERLKSNKN